MLHSALEHKGIKQVDFNLKERWDWILQKVLSCFTGFNGCKMKRLKPEKQTYAHWEKNSFLFFFTDAVGLYTVRLLWSINVNQHGFFWEGTIRSGYSRGLWGLASCQRCPLTWRNRSDAAGGLLRNSKRYEVREKMFWNHFNFFFSAVWCRL